MRKASFQPVHTRNKGWHSRAIQWYCEKNHFMSFLLLVPSPYRGDKGCVQKEVISFLITKNPTLNF
jgi:hypothetical protein